MQARCPMPRCDLEGLPESEEFFEILVVDAEAGGRFEDDLEEEDLDNGEVPVVSEDMSGDALDAKTCRES